MRLPGETDCDLDHDDRVIFVTATRPEKLKKKLRLSQRSLEAIPVALLSESTPNQ